MLKAGLNTRGDDQALPDGRTGKHPRPWLQDAGLPASPSAGSRGQAVAAQGSKEAALATPRGVAALLLSTLLALPIVTAPASAARAEQADSLFSGPSHPYVAPQRTFEVQVPPGWSPAEVPDDPHTVEFRIPDQPGDAFLVVRHLKVPPGASPRQILLKSIEGRLTKLPYYRELQRRSLKLGGRLAASVLATYAYQGNLQFPRALEEVVLVAGQDAYLLHFECFEPAAPAFADDLNSFYEAFTPRPAGSPGDPSGVDTSPFAPLPENPVEKIPF